MLANKLQLIKENLFNLHKPYWILISLAFMALALLLVQEKISHSTPPESSVNTATKSSQNIDTYIPEGFVLVALQISNLDSIHELIGPYGLADLYPTAANMEFRSVSTTTKNSMKKPLASRVRLIRAPNNTRLFGVLLPESERELILKLSDPVFVVLHNPKSLESTRTSDANNLISPRIENNSKSSESKPENNSSRRTISYGE